jgi:hypothetical protein
MIRPVFEKTLVRAGELRSYNIQMGSRGWDVSKKEVSKQDDQRIARQHHADWHQVERTLTRFEDEIAALRSDGWLDS